VNSFPYAVWLIPSGDLCGQLGATVGDLAVRFNAPPFGPHLTLCSGEWAAGLPALKTAMAGFCRGLAPVWLGVEGFGHTDDFFTFFFIRLSDDNSQRLFERAASAISGARSAKVGPHISLLYSDRSPAINRATAIDRAELVQEITPILPAQISFDSAQLVMPARGDWRDVSSWEVKCSIGLNRANAD
jgi:hypothetical protein